MALYAISDVHLSLSTPKPMDIFGMQWKDHHVRLAENWKSTVSWEDTVLLPGDISWALRLPAAMQDLEFLNGLPGRKIIISGNHDYWWESTSRMNSLFESIEFLRNNAVLFEGYAICGAKGWLCPGDPAFEEEEDRKLFLRELGRLSNSLEEGLRMGVEKMIVMIHYPPSPGLLNSGQEEGNENFISIIRQYPVEKVVFGHIHGMSFFSQPIQKDSISYYLTSADCLDFTPMRIL